MERMSRDILTHRVAGADVVQTSPMAPRLDLSPLRVRQDSTPVFQRPEAQRYCTAGQLAMEDYITKAAGQPRLPRITADRARELAASVPSLSEDQRAAVAGLLSSGRMIDLLSGPAGTGKTTVVATFTRLYRQETGCRVIGLAASESATRELATAGMDQTHNIANFLGKLEGTGRTRGHLPVHAGDVIVVDEASTTANLDFAAIERIADRNGARMVPVGDPKQLDAPEQGGAMRLISNEHSGYELTQIHRFEQEWEKDASVRLRAGDSSALAEYAAHGRLRAGTLAGMRRLSVDCWLEDHLAGKPTIMMHQSNDECAQLAAMARQRLIDLGGVADRCDVTLADRNLASAGDLLIARQNAKDVDAGGQPLANRDRVILDGWQGDNAVMRRELGSGQWSAPFQVPRSYLERHSQLGYAGNSWVSEGATVKGRAQALADSRTSREHLYVDLTRSTCGNFLNTVVDGVHEADLRPDPAQAGRDDPRPQVASAEAIRDAALRRESAALTATETIAAEHDRQDQMPFLVDVLRAATREGTTRQADTVLRQRLTERDDQRYASDPERFLLRQQLRELQLRGADTGQLLAAASERDMAGARSVAAVLHGRVRQLTERGPGAGPAGPPDPVSWQTTVPQIDDTRLCALAREAGRMADERAAALAEQTIARPPAWALSAFGPVPAGTQQQAGWAARAAAVASYRELAGHHDAQRAIGDPPAAGNAGWRAAWRAAAAALGMPEDDRAQREAPDGDHHHNVIAAERAEAWAPPSRQAEVDQAAAAVAADPGNETAVDAYIAAAGQQADRADWDNAHTSQREHAQRSAAELRRRQAGMHDLFEPAGQTEPAEMEPGFTGPGPDHRLDGPDEAALDEPDLALEPELSL